MSSVSMTRALCLNSYRLKLQDITKLKTQMIKSITNEMQSLKSHTKRRIDGHATNKNITHDKQIQFKLFKSTSTSQKHNRVFDADTQQLERYGNEKCVLNTMLSQIVESKTW